MTYTKVCDQDGAEFEATREHARFCSGRCRVAWYRAHAGEVKDVTRDSARADVTGYGDLGSGGLGEFLVALGQGQLEHCLFEALWNVLPATVQGKEWLGEIVAAQKSRAADPAVADGIVNDYLRHFYAHVLLSATFARIWKIAFQAGAESAPEMTSTPGRSTAALVAQIAELTGKLETRNAEAFLARVRVGDREAVTASLKNSAAILQEWAVAGDLF